MEDGDIKKYVIDRDNLDVDWVRQRVDINERLGAKGSRRVGIWAYASLLFVAVVIMIISAWHVEFEMTDEVASQIYLYEETDYDYIPDCLYVLNGFADGGN